MWLGWFAQSALACGGFFCNGAVAPIPDQSAEEIVFAVDDQTGEIEMHVEVSWSGASEDFAWILPVPAEPELFLSDQELFDTLAWLTDPLFFPSMTNKGRCGPIQAPSLACVEYAPTSALPPPDVTVVDAARIGPYDTVTVKADTEDDLVDWLVAHDYDLPPGLEAKLAPYVATDSHFVAMRLATDADVGDIEPIGLRFQGDKPSIPIQLTAVAAAEDMPIRVYVFSYYRAVPESYLDVTINEAAIDWTYAGNNYMEVLARAVDAAGGQAFVTEFARHPPRSYTSEIYDDLATRYRYLTRMTTALSAHEMTVDPVFAFRHDLDGVDNVHQATVRYDCKGAGDNQSAPATTVLEDGRRVKLGVIDFGPWEGADVLSDLQGVPALTVSDLAPDGEGLLVDFSDEAQAALDTHNAKVDMDHGCGCDHTRLAGSAVGLLMVLTVAGRRREG